MRNATATPAIDRLVDVEDLVCPGCDEQVYPEARRSRMPSADVAFCQRDGSPLCTDARGRVCEPVEATQ